jgi:hypothetical protein
MSITAILSFGDLGLQFLPVFLTVKGVEQNVINIPLVRT